MPQPYPTDPRRQARSVRGATVPGTVVRQPLIPAPSYDVLSTDFHEVQPGGPNPVQFVNRRQIEPVPFNDVDRPIRQSDFNTRSSLLDLVYSIWWPGESTWQWSHGEGKTNQPQPLAAMPGGKQHEIPLRGNIRQPKPFSQGELQFAAEELESELVPG